MRFGRLHALDAAIGRRWYIISFSYYMQYRDVRALSIYITCMIQQVTD